MKRGRRPRLELTSLLDVMFLVLVVFIYSLFNRAVHRGLRVDLPRGGGAVEPGERIVITVGADDALQLNGLDLPREEIVRRVKALAEAKVELPVLVSGDRQASLGAGVELLGELRTAGVSSVSFLVKGTQ